ncbi:MAG: pitrilysin family protein [Gemmatimonadota bacterium]
MSGLSIPFERHTLDNGLKVVLAPDDTVPIVATNLWYGVGSRNEIPGRTGFAHLFEHMMFQGSQHVPKNKHFELIEKVGGSANATTWFDRTNYFEKVPSNDLELSLWLESDRMGFMLPAMTQEKLDNQRDVVKNEKRQRYDNQPYGDWEERLLKLIFPEDHPYRHTVIGSMADIDAATLDDVSDFFETFYVPNNAVLTLAGDFVPAEAIEQIKRYFGDIERGAPIPALPGNPTIDPKIGTTVRDDVSADVPLPRVIMGHRIPPYSSPDFAVAQVAESLLGKGRASRFYSRLVRERRVAKSVVVFVYPLLTGASMMLVWATGYPDTELDALEAAVSEELESLAAPNQSEIDRAITLTETDLVRSLERVAERADQLSMFDLYFDDPGRLNRELDRLRAVSLEQVSAFASEYLVPDNRAVVTFQPMEAR